MWFIAVKTSYSWITVKGNSFIPRLLSPHQSALFPLHEECDILTLLKWRQNLPVVSARADFTLPRSGQESVLVLKLKFRSSWLSFKAHFITLLLFPQPSIGSGRCTSCKCSLKAAFLEVNFCLLIQPPHLEDLSTFSRFLSNFGSLCWKQHKNYSSAKETLITFAAASANGRWQKFKQLAPVAADHVPAPHLLRCPSFTTSLSFPPLATNPSRSIRSLFPLPFPPTRICSNQCIHLWLHDDGTLPKQRGG